MNAALRGRTGEYPPYQLRATMGKLGVSGAELARLMGVSRQWVSVRRNGQQRITDDDAERIAEALGSSLPELRGESAGPRQRWAPVLGDVQDFLDNDRSPDWIKQSLLMTIRHNLNMAVEARDGVPQELSHEERMT